MHNYVDKHQDWSNTNGGGGGGGGGEGVWPYYRSAWSPYQCLHVSWFINNILKDSIKKILKMGADSKMEALPYGGQIGG